MIYVEAPNVRPVHSYDHPAVFLAGGITGCHDWQASVRERMADDRVVLLNPRRADFVVSRGDSAAQQIEWEWRYLHDPGTSTTMFWFPACIASETVQPIALFELGCALGEQRRIVVGAHPGYPRRADIVLQAALFDATLIVFDHLDDVIDATREAIS